MNLALHGRDRQSGERTDRDAAHHGPRNGLQGAIRGRTFKTTIADEAALRPSDLVHHTFTATCPNELWVADWTYVVTWCSSSMSLLA